MAHTPWAYDTSYEDSNSIMVFTGGGGKLYFLHDDNGQHMSIKYSYGTLGVSKGGVVNVAKSLVSTPSGGWNVQELGVGGRRFNNYAFPSGGLLVTIGASAGIFAPSFFDDAGLCVCLWIFGAVPPFAAVFSWGRFSSGLPTAGLAAGVVSFSEAVTWQDVSDLPDYSNVG